jgi:transcriptional regulator with XRE-family HTH domain
MYSLLAGAEAGTGGERQTIGESRFDPSGLLDSLSERLLLKNDAALSRALDISPPMISRIRHGRQKVGGAILLRMHEVSGLSIDDLRTLMGDRRRRLRIGGGPRRQPHG